MSLKLIKPFMAGALLSAACVMCGCEQKEKLIDIETPAGEVEVEQDKDTGAIETEVTEN